MSLSLPVFQSFRNRVDERSGSLSHLHAKHLSCKPGCHDCCTDFGVFPVEYHAILSELRIANVTLPPPDPNASCAFLQNGLCAIYEHRPIICRTHGLPVAFADDEEGTMNVDFCPKNFTEASPEALQFDGGNTLNLDQLNFELYEINTQYVESREALPQRIPLRQLHEDLKR